MELLYHNHNCEFLQVAPNQSAYQLLLAETDPDVVNFEFDSYWCAECGANPLAVMNALGNRMKLWHINDRGTRQEGPCMTPILKSDSMELGCVEAVILESHRNWIDKSPVKSFERSAEFLNAHF